MKQFIKRRPYTVIVEGNIGSGKTTFLNYFQQYDDVNVLAEPVNKWRDCNGFNLLVSIYIFIQKYAGKALSLGSMLLTFLCFL